MVWEFNSNEMIIMHFLGELERPYVTLHLHFSRKYSKDSRKCLERGWPFQNKTIKEMDKPYFWHIKRGQIKFLHCQWSQLVTTLGFLLAQVRGDCGKLQCVTKLRPKSDWRGRGEREKPSVLLFAFLLMRKCCSCSMHCHGCRCLQG